MFNQDVMEMKVKDMLDVLTDWNWHTERVLIEAILSGDSEAINNMLVVAIHHQLAGHLVDEMSDLRKRSSWIIDDIRKGDAK
jgi:hypothetical protein